MWLLSLGGCWWFPPTTTSSSGMAAVVLDAEGQPMVDLLVETVESTERTDAEGKVGLYYKRPDTHLHFTHDGVWFRRRYQKADNGKVVTLQLPETSPLTVNCGPHVCDVELTWDLGAGFSGKARTRCEAGASPSVDGAPTAEPNVQCREGTNAPLTLTTRYAGQALTLEAPERDVRVGVSLDGASVGGCEITVAERTQPSGGGQAMPFTVRGAGVAHATCDARPAWPTPFDAVVSEVTVGWTPDGPELQLPPGMELTHLALSWSDGELSVRPTEEGAFLLPPLPKGSYNVVLYASERPGSTTGIEPIAKPGVVVANRLAGGAVVGVLLLDRDLSEGVVEVEVGP